MNKSTKQTATGTLTTLLLLQSPSQFHLSRHERINLSQQIRNGVSPISIISLNLIPVSHKDIAFKWLSYFTVMGFALFTFITNHWPFKKPVDDLALSDKLVNTLSIPENTKRFVYAYIEPETQSVVYILAAQNLSKQSALDAEVLIKEVRPEVVVTQVAPSSLAEIRSEEKINNNTENVVVPTSLFGVLKGCFLDKIGKEKYESLAGSVFLKEIFGVGLHGHFFAAKRAAEEVGSPVFFIESPFVSTCAGDNDKSEVQGFGLVAQDGGLPKRLLFSSRDLQSETAKSVIAAMSQLSQKPSASNSVADADTSLRDIQPRNDYEVPSFAQSVYPFLIDLHNVFGNLPSIETALAHAQRMLYSVDKGERVDAELLSEVQAFQVAVEGLRIGMNSAGRRPINKDEKSTSEYAELSTEDKSHALFAQTIRSQTQKFKSVVAVVDANSIAGLRKHWNTVLPPDVKDLIQQFISQYEGVEKVPGTKSADKKSLIGDKTVVAVGAGATAVLGASSLSKIIPASTLKLVAYSVPTSLKLGFLQTQKVMAIALGKVLGPSKLVAPGFMSSGANSSFVMKGAASANKVRAVTHSVRAYAQRTSISATRTAFYEIMRRRRFQPIGYVPWVKFGCSVSACASLLVYGDGIECAVESLPVAPSIASLGRGLQNLHKANQEFRMESSSKMQEAIHSLMHRFRVR